MDKMRSSLSKLFPVWLALVALLSWESSASLTIEGNQRGGVTWYTNATGAENTVGSILNVSLSNCALGDCYLQKGVIQSLSIYFRAGEDHDALLYNFYMTSGMSHYWISGGTGLRNVSKGIVYEFFKNFYVDDEIASGNNAVKVFIFRPSSPAHVFELDIEFTIDGVYDDIKPSTISPTTLEPPASTSTWATSIGTPNITYSPEPTTFTPETTTTQVPTSSTPGPFRCEDSGFYPDPFSCTIYHVCTQFSDGSYWDQLLECASGTTFCPDRNICDYAINCPCWLP